MHVTAAGKHWHAPEDICVLLSSTGVLVRYILPELDMQVFAKVVLKYFLASTGMLQKTARHCWKALLAKEPPVQQP